MFSSGYVQLGLSSYCGRSYVNDDIRLRLPASVFVLGSILAQGEDIFANMTVI